MAVHPFFSDSEIRSVLVCLLGQYRTMIVPQMCRQAVFVQCCLSFFSSFFLFFRFRRPFSLADMAGGVFSPAFSNARGKGPSFCLIKQTVSLSKSLRFGSLCSSFAFCRSSKTALSVFASVSCIFSKKNAPFEKHKESTTDHRELQQACIIFLIQTSLLIGCTSSMSKNAYHIVRKYSGFESLFITVMTVASDLHRIPDYLPTLELFSGFRTAQGTIFISVTI